MGYITTFRPHYYINSIIYIASFRVGVIYPAPIHCHILHDKLSCILLYLYKFCFASKKRNEIGKYKCMRVKKITNRITLTFR